MKKIIVFNWKMEPQSLLQAHKLLEQYIKILRTTKYGLQNNFIICPPFVYLNELKNLKTEKLKSLKLGAQDVFYENPLAGKGYYTGEISPKMLKNLGVEYVIIGHSERRQILGETDEMINKKVLATLKAGLKVILCVGENLNIRKKGKKAVENFIKSQLQKDLKNVASFKIQDSNLVIAYEPIWAINTGHSDTPEDAMNIINFIKETLSTKPYTLNPQVLYGGSVDSQNIKNFLQYKEIDGFLIGHASLKPKEIENIIKIIQ